MVCQERLLNRGILHAHTRSGARSNTLIHGPLRTALRLVLGAAGRPYVIEHGRQNGFDLGQQLLIDRTL